VKFESDSICGIVNASFLQPLWQARRRSPYERYSKGDSDEDRSFRHHSARYRLDRRHRLRYRQGPCRGGADVVVNGRSQAKVDQAIASIGKIAPSAKVRGVVADVSTAEGCAALVKAVPQVDILINNAGIFEPKPFFDTPDADWHRFFDVNVMSGVRLSRAYMPDMLKKNWGRIVFISSELALNISGEMIHYGMTKTALLAVSRGLAELTRGTSVTVNSVLPGPTMSEAGEAFVKNLAEQSGQSVETAAKEFIKQHRGASLIQRFASVEEIANMVVYVASRESSATNGAALRAEGGIVQTIA
jgi:NAD(P)-dependent dehydrogenase (short-subunit alcohol dehydrogenase family)